MTIELTGLPPVTFVPEDRRENFLPVLFGLRHLIKAERTVYKFMRLLSPHDYRGGSWNFYELDGQPLFLAPDTDRHFRIESGITEYRGEVSAEAAGIIATLFTFSYLASMFLSDHLAEGYHRLRDWSDTHAEAAAIFSAID